MDRERSAFDHLLDGVLAGRLSRRQVLGRAAALGLSAASIQALGLAARAHAQDATPAGSGETPKPGGVLKVGLQADPTALDPHKQSLTAIWHVVEHVYNGLTRVRADLTVEPDLAERWEISADGLTYTFALRQGVTFHDGTPLKASDVKFSFERLKDPEIASPSASDLASVETIEAPDDATVVLTLSTPDAALLSVLAGQSCIVMSEAFVAANNNDVSQVAMGTGPFKFVEYVPNTSVTLEKNPDYHEEGLPYLDGIEMLIASDDTSRTTAVVTGTVDFIEYAPLRDIPILEEDESIVLAGDANTNIRMIGFNCAQAPFDNVLVRQAIAAIVDREAVLGPTVFGYGTPTEVVFPEAFWAALPQDVRPPDPERAAALMAEAEMSDGFATTITSWSQYSFLSNAAVVIQEQLKALNIEAELNLVENATMIDQVYVQKTYEMAVTGTSAYVDPNQVMQDFKTGESGNFANYSNPRVDELVQQGIAATDQAERVGIYQEIQQILLDEVPGVNLFIANQFEAMKSAVKGYTNIPTGSNVELRRTWLDR